MFFILDVKGGIYMISMHYVLGFNNEIEGKTVSQIQALYPNFKMKDTAELAKAWKLAECVDASFRRYIVPSAT